MSNKARPFTPKYSTSYEQHSKRIKTMLAEGLHDGMQWQEISHQRYAELEEADQLIKTVSSSGPFTEVAKLYNSPEQAIADAVEATRPYWLWLQTDGACRSRTVWP